MTAALASPVDTPEVYAASARLLRDSGLGSPLPLPPGRKFPPPQGWTGANGPMPSPADVEAWCEEHPGGNVALRLADGVVGVDVDGYAGKKGHATLRAAEQALGPLPNTFWSTSRNDGVSGIRLFRVPAGAVLASTLGAASYGPDVEVVQRHHRYVVASPSRHPEGRTYVWLTPSGTTLPAGVVPDLSDLPDLPAPWLAGLSVDAQRAEVGADVLAPPQNWRYATTTTHPYVTAMLAHLGSDDPRSDWHAWTFTTCCRLAAAVRLELITEEDLKRGRSVLIRRLREALSARSSSEDPVEEARRCWRDAVERTSRMDEGQARGSLGLRAPGSLEDLTDLTTAPQAPPGGSPPAPPSQPQAAGLEDFWARPAHARLHQFAQARRVSPWAMLGAVLARVVVATPHHVALPPMVGGPASLNLFVGLVGPSGTGKGASESAAAGAITMPGTALPYVVPLGSGEGLVKAFAHFEGGAKGAGLVRDRDAVLFSVPEIDTIAAVASRQGATLLPQLRQAFMGEQVGFHYADQAKRIILEPHTYRLALTVGIQPSRAGGLLDDADGGTPQRFLWMPTLDPTAPEAAPVAPEPLEVVTHAWPPSGSGLHYMPVPPLVLDTVDSSRVQRLRGTSADPLDGHALLTRVKVSAALALLDSRRAVTEEDWALAGVVVQVSDATRAAVVAQAVSDAERRNEARGRSEGRRAAVAEDVRTASAIKRVAHRLQLLLDRSGEQSGSNLRGLLAARDRDLFEDALEALEQAGGAVIRQLDNGIRVAPAGAAR